MDQCSKRTHQTDAPIYTPKIRTTNMTKEYSKSNRGKPIYCVGRIKPLNHHIPGTMLEEIGNDFKYIDNVLE